MVVMRAREKKVRPLNSRQRERGENINVRQRWRQHSVNDTMER